MEEDDEEEEEDDYIEQEDHQEDDADKLNERLQKIEEYDVKLDISVIPVALDSA